MTPPNGTTPSPPPSRVLLEPVSRRILFEEHGKVLRHPASLTKLMLLYLVFSGLDAGRYRLTSTFQMTIAGAQSRGSRLGCPPGTVLSVEQAITALAVASANDVAVAIAETLAGSVQTAIGAMNHASAKLGIATTRFATPHGVDAPGQFTNARDMALLAMRIYIDFPAHRRFFGARSFDFRGIAIPNQNTLLPTYPGMNGLKTGTTPRAGCHLIGSAERDGRHLIAVVMGCTTKAKRNQATSTLLDFGFEGPRPASAGRTSDPSATSTLS